MKIRYFEDSDTLYMELNDNVLLELDEDGKVVALTLEHEKEARGPLDFSYETVAA